MTKVEIEQTLIEILRELQAGTGDQPCEITPTTTPLTDLGFFDSLLALETTIVLEERVGVSWKDDSVFADIESSNPLTVAQIADLLATTTEGAR